VEAVAVFKEKAHEIDDVIQKPFMIISLGKKIREVLHKKEERGAAFQSPPVDS